MGDINNEIEQESEGDEDDADEIRTLTTKEFLALVNVRFLNHLSSRRCVQ